jgi:hypothetical protein
MTTDLNGMAGSGSAAFMNAAAGTAIITSLLFTTAVVIPRGSAALGATHRWVPTAAVGVVDTPVAVAAAGEGDIDDH